MLAKFPEDVVTEVTHPALGLPRMKSWLPTVKEVFDACVKAVEPILEREREARIIAETLASRQADPDRTGRLTRDELQAKYGGENWGLRSLDKPERKPKPAPTAEELKAHYAKFDLAFQPKHEGE